MQNKTYVEKNTIKFTEYTLNYLISSCGRPLVLRHHAKIDFESVKQRFCEVKSQCFEERVVVEQRFLI